MARIIPPLGERDFLVMPTSVHVMRWLGYSQDHPNGWWRTACGSRISDENWYGAWYPTPAEIADHQLAVCGNCARTKPLVT